jgi:hypothetical protein
MNIKLIAAVASVLTAGACSYTSSDRASAYSVSAYTAEAHVTAPLTGLNSEPNNPNGTPKPQVPSMYDF